MNNIRNEALNAVENLNSIIIEACADKEYDDQFIGLEFKTDGNIVCIEFLGLGIWDSENDSRETLPDSGDYAETIEMYVKYKVLEILNVLSLIMDRLTIKKENKKEFAVKKALGLISNLNVEMTDPNLTVEEQFKFLWRLAFVDLQFLEKYRDGQ